MEKRKRLFKSGVTVAICLAILSSMVVFSAPGGTDDPVVTKSYIVEHVVPEIKAYIDERFGVAASEGVATSRTDTFMVVNVEAGKKVICEAGTELILRMGSGTVIATQKGGLADVTAGYDLSDGSAMPANHCLVVPVSDGRGFTADTNVIVMIKGGYTIK